MQRFRRVPGARRTLNVQGNGLGQIDLQQQLPPQPPPKPKVIAEDFYTYNILFEGLTAGSTDTGFIQIEADSDFLIQKLAYFALNDTDTLTTFNTIQIPSVDIVIVDTGSGRQLMNNPVPIPALFGDGRLPYILPTPKLFVKNSRINVTVNNIGTASVDYARLSINFEGKKIFTAG